MAIKPGAWKRGPEAWPVILATPRIASNLTSNQLRTGTRLVGTHEVFFPDLDTIVPKDVVRGCDMKEKLRSCSSGYAHGYAAASSSR